MAELIRYIDLFCGIGGFRYAMQDVARSRRVSARCVLSSDIDKNCQISYQANFGERPLGDISEIQASAVPDHDVLLAGFPCQPFSIIGERKGFEDIRGTLFFEIARILKEKRPSAFVLENVKLLRGHNGGQTLARILEALDGLNYRVEYRILNALDFGLPQKRERIWIVGQLAPKRPFQWPEGGMPMRSLAELLEPTVCQTHYASEHIRSRRYAVRERTPEPTIWHENKSGNIGVHPYACALRAGASHNYLLVNGERRLTSREMLRLQGFPEDFNIVCSHYQTRRQAGNSLPVNVARAVIDSLFESQEW